MPFVKVNCSAIPEHLIESELFGYVKGAFTGAGANKRGLFEVANRGSIFLDEVADLSMGAQAKILRVVQSGEMQKVGSEEPVKVDVRVLSGTHKELKDQVAKGLFREDLYYRLNVVPIRVPSLRERPEDIPLLVQFFARRVCEKSNIKDKPIDDEVLSELKRYHWPGNVRELQNVIERGHHHERRASLVAGYSGRYRSARRSDRQSSYGLGAEGIPGQGGAGFIGRHSTAKPRQHQSVGHRTRGRPKLSAPTARGAGLGEKGLVLGVTHAGSLMTGCGAVD